MSMTSATLTFVYDIHVLHEVAASAIVDSIFKNKQWLVEAGRGPCAISCGL
jgi:hypothetical protein